MNDPQETVPLGEQSISNPYRMLAMVNLSAWDIVGKKTVDVGGGVLGGLRKSLQDEKFDANGIIVIDPRIKENSVGYLTGNAENLPLLYRLKIKLKRMNLSSSYGSI